MVEREQERLIKWNIYTLYTIYIYIIYIFIVIYVFTHPLCTQGVATLISYFVLSSGIQFFRQDDPWEGNTELPQTEMNGPDESEFPIIFPNEQLLIRVQWIYYP